MGKFLEQYDEIENKEDYSLFIKEFLHLPLDEDYSLEELEYHLDNWMDAADDFFRSKGEQEE